MGSRSCDQTMQKDYNIPTLDFRKTCNIYDGGSRSSTASDGAAPFKGARVHRHDYYTSTTITFQLARPFPQFNGNMSNWDATIRRSGTTRCR